MNTQLWNSGNEKDKETVRKQKRKLTYVSNILVVKDPAHPENEGKVFLYKYGKKIFDKIKDLAEPQFEDEKAVNPFDFWEGANFKLKIRNVEGYRNYDKSEFESPSAVSSDDSEIEKIWNMQSSLTAFLEPRNFKSYEELKAKLDSVLNATSAPAMRRIEEDDVAEAPAPKAVARQAAQPAKPAPKKEVDFDDDEESLSYFAKLANEE
jgi:hypothetical protein